MAEQKSKRKHPSVGFYDEPGFVSLTTSLRKISGDDTIPTDKYVDIYKDLYDLITPDTIKSGVADITLSSNKRQMVIFYVNGTQKRLPLDDYVISQIYFDKFTKKVIFVFNNGERIDLDLNFLYELFPTKEEVTTEFTSIREEMKTISKEIEVVKEEVNTVVEEKITEIAGPIIEEKLGTEIDKIIEEKIEETFNDGLDVKWKNF